jgi:tRNA dimethylallyltransferase
MPDAARPADPLLVVLLGPTGSGKTALSLYLAETFGGEIVNCDSIALYRGFDIGSAKPTPEEMARAPHHLFGTADPAHEVTAGEYARQARAVLAEIRSRRRLPIVAGGTGLYLRALLEGLFPGPQRSEELREKLRARAAARGPEYLHKILLRLDPAGAKAIHCNDIPKVIRAIEVSLAARQPMSEQWQQGRDALTGFRIVRFGLNPDRTALYERIDARCVRMFEAGLIAETRNLIEIYGSAIRPLGALGYKQAAAYLAGNMDLSEAIRATQQGHRNYAKRQMTWFRREPEVLWLQGFGDDPAAQLAFSSLLPAV